MKSILFNAKVSAALFAGFVLLLCIYFQYLHPGAYSWGNYLVGGSLTVIITVLSFLISFAAFIALGARNKQRRLTKEFFKARAELHQQRTLKAQENYNRVCEELESFLRDLQAK